MGGMLMTFTNIFYISRKTKNKIASSRFFPHIQSDHLLEFVKCGCKSGCDSNRCGCKRANLQCTELCKCRTDCKFKKSLLRNNFINTCLKFSVNNTYVSTIMSPIYLLINSIRQKDNDVSVLC